MARIVAHAASSENTWLTVVLSWACAPARWLSAAPAPRSRRGSAARCARVRALFTPLLPDDYLELINPLWSTQELRGRIERIERETDDAVDGRHQAGLGVAGPRARPVPAHRRRRRRRPPLARLLADLRPRAPGRLHQHHAQARRGGQGLALPRAPGAARARSSASAASRATFVLPDPLPDTLLFISAGSGITPIMSMLRDLDRARRAATTSCTCTPRARPTTSSSATSCASSAARHPGFRLHEQLTGERRAASGPSDLDDLCPDWREREAFLCGPGRDARRDDRALGARGRLRAPAPRALPAHHRPGDGELGEGGTIRFTRQRRRGAAATARQPILVAGEEAGATLPFGCRMGICHTCVGQAVLRPGSATCAPARCRAATGEMVRTCVNAPEGPVEIAL